MSPARRLFSARRFAKAATGSGNRTTLEGSPGGRPIRFAVSAMKPSDDYMIRLLSYVLLAESASGKPVTIMIPHRVKTVS